MRRKITAIVATAVFVLVSSVLFGAVASAATSGGSSRYVTQALAAGLTPAQAQALQRKVDGYLAAEPGSHQVSANRIDFRGGTVTIAVPGQSRPRDLGAPAGAVVRPYYGDFPCTYGYLCIFQYNDANLLGTPGEEVDYYYCGTYSLPDWVSQDGALTNDETPGTVARFEGATHNVLFTSTAYQAVGGVNWDPVYYVVPC